MKIKPEFATDDVRNYPLGYVIIAENEDEEKILNIIRNMYFFGYVKYAGRVDSDNGNVRKLMFENPRTIEKCLEGVLKGTICKEHAERIICSRGDFAPHLSPTDFKEIVKSQFEILD